MVITDKAPARSGGVRPHGIVIKERQSDQGQNRSEQSNRPSVRRALLGTTGQELSTTAPVHGEEDRRSGVGKERAAMGLVTGDKTGHVVADIGVESAVERENFGDVEDARGADVDLYLTAVWKNPCTRKGDSGSIGHPDKLGPSSPVPPRTNLTHCNGSTGSVDRPNKAHAESHGTHQLGKGMRVGRGTGRAQSPPKPVPTQSPHQASSPPHDTEAGPFSAMQAQPEHNQDPIPTDQVHGQRSSNESTNPTVAQINDVEAHLAVNPIPRNLDVMAYDSTESISPMRPSTYIKAHFNPSAENIKALNNGLMIDLSNATLKKIGNTWNLLTEDAWDLLTSGRLNKELQKQKTPFKKNMIMR
ncbi:hypothetical protein J5N97_007439 [Dioscorea zingiberensis]|uniref:Uncharacterized protein n=1 Tax=Dioscorea zingiberensis TaxID=325984 RepID=A0A9D5DBS5_9LILI|nr:hypothetical protein J5N97_007439 [Dioscorea zingiberensis]